MSTVIDVTRHARRVRSGDGDPAVTSAAADDPSAAVSGAEDAASDPLAEAVRQAAEVVARGGLIVVPTDTVYGIGADAFDPGAVAELLAAKGRGRDTPPPVLVPNKRTIEGLATQIPAYARRLVDQYWPGPLTLVLRAQASLMWDLGDTNGTVAVRMPDDDVTLSVLAETGPLAVSSANRHGEPSATTLAQAQEQLGESVDLYLDGGASSGGQASTIVDCTKDEPVILRHGALEGHEVLAVARGDVDETTAEPEAPPEDSEVAQATVVSTPSMTPEPDAEDAGGSAAAGFEHGHGDGPAPRQV